MNRVVEITNSRGLHARASAKFCSVAGQFNSVVSVTRDGVTVGGCSIMGLLMLGASKGCEIMVTAEGDDEEQALAALTELIENRFGEKE
ncbi:MAG: HPr family phosphocarrier protein [Pseudomonadota bacterium]